MNREFYLGCPVWAWEGWRGSLFAAKAARPQWLRQYGQVFNTVEGNSTFYGLPQVATVRRWAEDTPDGFRFALKFPKAISHERRLVDAGAETREFLSLLTLLADADRLGPSFLQLPPNFARSEFPALERFLRGLPDDIPFAVEVRHRDYFDGRDFERRLDDLLRARNMDRVLLDSRPLFSAEAEDESETGAQAQKPQSPHRTTVTGSHPLVRLIGRNNVEAMTPWLIEWAPIVARWIDDGLTPFFFTHTPDVTFAPEVARRFHAEVAKHSPRLSPLPAWPGETEARAKLTQPRLF